MGWLPHILKSAVAAAITALFTIPLAANEQLDGLMADLRGAEPAAAERIAREVELIWRQSGSASADLLLKRGRDAMEVGEFEAAVDHFSALTDHAPDFTEGWVGRASAFVNLERYGLALSDLEHALALNPQHYEAIYGLGVILETIGQPEEAYEAYLILQTIHPHYPELTDALMRLDALAKGRSL